MISLMQCRDLYDSLLGRDRDYSLGEGLLVAFMALTETHPDDYIKIISNYLKHDATLAINPHGIIKLLLKNYGANETFNFIDSNNFKRKHLWQTCYYVPFIRKRYL